MCQMKLSSSCGVLAILKSVATEFGLSFPAIAQFGTRPLYRLGIADGVAPPDKAEAMKSDSRALEVNERRLARAGGDGDVIKAQVPAIFNGEGAPKAQAAIEPDAIAAQQVQVQHGQEVLIPADGDAILETPPKPIRVLI